MPVNRYRKPMRWSAGLAPGLRRIHLGRRVVDLIYLLAALASGSMVAATNYYLVEPVTLALLYAVPVGLCAFRFHYVAAGLASSVVLGLTLFGQALRPGSLYFDTQVLTVALVAISGLLAAKIGSDRASAEHHSGVHPATGLASHRAILGALSLEMTRCARYGRPISVLLGGPDLPVEASPAEVARDLGRLGSLLESEVRDIDVVGHYGPADLLVILPETRKEDAYAVAQRLHVSVQRAVSHPRGRQAVPPLSVSFGVAGYPDDASSLDSLLDSAEDALFEARTLGGNRTHQARKYPVANAGR